MLSLFRTNQAYAGLLLFVYAFLLWLPLFFMVAPATVVSPGDGALGAVLTNWMSQHPYLAVITSVLLVGFQGIQMNTLATRHQLSRTVTQFPGLLLVLVSALVYSCHGFNAFQVANVFLLFGMLSLGRLYKREEPAVALFNAGAWLGLASLFRPEYGLFLLAFFTGLSILRRVELRSVLQILTGGGLIYFFLIVFSYFKGNLGAVLSEQFSAFGWPTLLPTSVPNKIGLGVIGLVIIGVLLGYRSITTMLNIEGSKNTSLLAWTMLYAILVIAFSGEITPLSVQAATVPLGGLLGLGLVTIKPSRAEVVHLLLVVAAVLPLLLSLFGGADAGAM